MTRRSFPPSRTVRSLASQRQKVTVLPRKTDKKGKSSAIEPPTLTVQAKTVKTRPRQSNQKKKKTPSSLVTSMGLYLLRLGIIGVGLGAIAGTILPLVDPIHLLKLLKRPLPKLETTIQTPSKTPVKPSPVVEVEPIPLSQELLSLNTKLTAVAAKYPNLQPQAFFVDLDNGNYVNFNGDVPIAAASTIKVPILVAFFQEVDAGKVHLDEQLIMDQEVIAGGSGDMQYQTPGKKYTALETAAKMIIISDNTATNMLIRRLGGQEVLNQRFKEWGLTQTVINNPLPDLEGTNTTSPKDLTLLLAKVSRGQLVSLKSRDRLLGIMEKTKTRTLLPQGIEETATIAHKTGDIGKMLGDTGVIDIPTGKRYVGTVLTKRPHNDIAGRQLIQEMSRTTYQHFKWYLPRSALKPSQPTPQPQSDPSLEVEEN